MWRFRSPALRAVLAVAASFAAAASVHAGEAEPAHPHPYEAPAGAPLSLDEARRLALTDQPILDGRAAAIEADEQQAVAVAQLPDPKLSAGLKDLPVDRGEAFSVRDDNFTTFSAGLSQELPRGDKRRLRGERKRLDAEVQRAGLQDDRRSIGRDAALAWLDVYEAEQALALTQQLADESALQVQSLDSGYRSGRGTQADWLAARVEAGLVNDKLQDWRHHVERLRAALSRWIGEAAARPLDADLSALAQPVEWSQLGAGVERHPLVSGLQKQVEGSDNEVALAKQAYRPDFAVEGYFGYRPAYADFVGVQVTMDLPWFTAKRQDRELAAALRQADAARDRKADALRALHAQASEDYIDWRHTSARTASFDSDIIPQAQRRAAAAQDAYAAGSGGFDALLAARRGLLEVRLQRLALAVDAARAQVRLRYFTEGN